MLRKIKLLIESKMITTVNVSVQDFIAIYPISIILVFILTSDDLTCDQSSYLKMSIYNLLIA